MLKLSIESLYENMSLLTPLVAVLYNYIHTNIWHLTDVILLFGYFCFVGFTFYVTCYSTEDYRKEANFK